MKQILSFLVLIVAGAGIATAASGGSAYSIFGIGDLRYFPGMKSHGMGYASMGIAGPTAINPFSPGSWSHISSVQFEAGMLYEGFGSTDGERSIYRATANFNGGLLALPISTRYGVTFVGGFIPYSTINYNNYTGGSQEGIDYALNHFGTGGISQGMAGFSCTPFRGLSIGASIDYLFGNSSRTRIMLARGSPSATTSGGIERIDLYASGLNAQVGALVENLGAIAEPLRPFSVGVSFTTASDLTTEQRSFYDYAAERDSSGTIAGSTRIPERLGIGVAYQAGRRYQIAADFVSQPWASSSSPSLKNSYRFCVGAERLPSADHTAPLLERMSFRAGATWYATPFRVSGRNIDEWGVTVGFGIPITPLTRLETSFEYGGRGTTDENLISDTIFRFHIALSLGEIWFVRPEEE